VALLNLAGVSAWYGSAQVLFDVDLEIGEGEMVGLLGRNGAGKSTTFKSVMGIEARRHGSIRLGDAELSRKLPEDVARAGIAWVPPDRRIFPGLSVMDNLRLAASTRGVKLDVDEIVDVIPIMSRLIDRQGFQLSGGEQQAVAIARALAARPKVLLLDEPTEGLAPLVVRQLEESIAALPGRLGVSVLLAEQNLQFVLRLTSRVYVLETGRMVHHGTSEEFGNAPDLQHRYLSVSSAGQSNPAPSHRAH
jgi:branched-chain amino acid transport system ATP-binding protein